MTPTEPLHLFAGYGIELEYMIVHRATLDVLPVTDKILYEIAGAFESEVDLDSLSWSNELVLHVIELKTNGPAASLDPLAALFQQHVGKINEMLLPMDGRLMPSAMHPWMNPVKETKLWPHEYNPVYQAYDRIFGCTGHGWANLQSTHINLPFADDKEFGQLHTAIRMLMPIMPALTASSPIIERESNGALDRRLQVYQNNQKRVPLIIGKVIPEPAISKNHYIEHIHQRIYRAIEPHDPEGILQYEWLNSRGAIARFMRNTIEIRVLDIQECPAADLAIAKAISTVLHAQINEQWIDFKHQLRWETDALAAILHEVIRDADRTVIDNRQYLQAFAFPERKCVAAELWQHLLEETLAKQPGDNEAYLAPLSFILQNGTLARRILAAVDGNFSRKNLAIVYGKLCECLAEGKQFLG
ncbi:glutamate--cysteine ligase [candidate division KSB1 bacterium]|nr:glutamate--cysteine ligase [candidate division KSB1 bacterium]